MVSVSAFSLHPYPGKNFASKEFIPERWLSEDPKKAKHARAFLHVEIEHDVVQEIYLPCTIVGSQNLLAHLLIIATIHSSSWPLSSDVFFSTYPLIPDILSFKTENNQDFARRVYSLLGA